MAPRIVLPPPAGGRESAPKVVAQSHGERDRRILAVEFCTYCPDCWGDIVFWHVEVGRGLFSIARRPIYHAPRVQE